MMEEKILQIMQEVFDVEHLDATCSQQNCEEWDSINHLNLVVELEEAFNVSLEPEVISQMTSFDEVVKAVKEAVEG